MNIKEQGNGDK